MAEDINSVTIVGRLTRDAELRYTNNNFAITKMGLAVNSSKKEGDQWVEVANFFDITLLGRRGESLNQYLQKGTKLAINGVLQQERWEQDGQKRSKVTILANKIQLLGGQTTPGNNSVNTPTLEVNDGGNGNGEDIPF